MIWLLAGIVFQFLINAAAFYRTADREHRAILGTLGTVLLVLGYLVVKAEGSRP